MWAFRHVVPAIGLFVVLAPLAALAQTNIDQGKSPAELFAGDCATCHKSARGLANGRGSSALAGFLVEHYTASRDQAAALAAYVLGAGGGQAAPATQSRASKPTPDKPERASVEEPKPSARTRDRAKPDENPATARTRPPEEERKGEGTVRIMQEPNGTDRRGTPTRREPEPAVASPSHQAVPEPAPAASQPTSAPAPVVVAPPPTPAASAPAAVVATPAPSPPAAAAAAPAPAQASGAAATPGPTAAAPAASDSGEGEAVPRDNIPD
jgi:hypothetical protein